MFTPGDLGGLPSHIPTLPSLLGERNYSSLLLGKTKIDELIETLMTLVMEICIVRVEKSKNFFQLGVGVFFLVYDTVQE